MTRLLWKGSLLAALAAAGVARGQGPAAKGPAPATGQVVSVQEKDGLPESCRLLQSWTTADGRKACLVESLDTGERLTVVQKGAPAGSTKQVGAAIWRWGNFDTPPAGSPAPPPAPAPAPPSGKKIVTPPPPPDSGVRQAWHAAEFPTLSRVAPPPPVPPAPPAPIADCAAPPAKAPTGGLLGSAGHPCTYVHYSERAPRVEFRPGGCLPVSTPEHSPDFGYYPTQWRPWPGGVGCAPPPAVFPAPADDREPLPEPHVAPAAQRAPGTLPTLGPPARR